MLESSGEPTLHKWPFGGINKDCSGDQLLGVFYLVDSAILDSLVKPVVASLLPQVKPRLFPIGHSLPVVAILRTSRIQFPQSHE